MTITSGYRAENIPADADVVVIGNAMKRGNPEVEAVLNRKLYYLSLPEVLKNYFLRGRHNLVVTGTHGKTTTTALLTWIMTEAGFDPSYMIGGIPKNLGQGARFNDSKYFVIEGDEYDTAFFDKRSKFVHYLPELVIVNNIEFDHADIFDNLDADQAQLPPSAPHRAAKRNGAVEWRRCQTASRWRRNALAPIVEIGFSENCAQQIRDVTYSADGSRFTLGSETFDLPLVGEFNVRNAAMAITAARFYGVPFEKIRTALDEFQGIARRQEVRGEVRGVKVIDDFGHHPTAIAQTLTGLRQRYPGRRLWAVFEPRSNTTRRAVFQHQLSEALQMADGVFMAQVARLEQIPEDERLESRKRSSRRSPRQGGRPFTKRTRPHIVDRLVPLLKADDVVVVFSNGGFDGIHEQDAVAAEGVGRPRSRRGMLTRSPTRYDRGRFASRPAFVGK